MKLPLALLAVSTVVLTSCTTLENRRDMYSPQKVNGPYTRMLRDGIPKPQPVGGTAQGGSMSDGKSVVR
ncbi:MAG: hypothetical protein ACOYNN_10615 [Terrimicrobiaceae bacterium]